MSPAQMNLLYVVPIAYLVGSVPFGLLVGLSRGVDVRTAGSGNIGATNVGRLLGGRFFALVFLLDLCKGLLPMLGAGWIVRMGGDQSTLTFVLWLLVGFAAIAGHMFSLFLRFKGGKGVATSAGVVLGLYPFFTLPGLVALLVWSALFFKTRIVSLASIAAAGLFPAAYLGFAIIFGWSPFTTQLPLFLFALLIGILIVYRHRANIARLRAGTELRFSRRHSEVGKDGHHQGNGDGTARLP